MVSSLETARAFGVSAKLARPSHRRLGEGVKTTKLCARQFLKIRKQKIKSIPRKFVIPSHGSSQPAEQPQGLPPTSLRG
ncbi:hypothetical protein [Sinorhizobium sp. NFACC03]|uniref:hypothetical protein n=1 Tax=Sinorhizobium sp. NFACC03 TaxID=1566295 RepID=UPI00115F960F|nr:hypothetical protein [Sinorhizobium sp. NFACC03]